MRRFLNALLLAVAVLPAAQPALAQLQRYPAAAPRAPGFKAGVTYYSAAPFALTDMGTELWGNFVGGQGVTGSPASAWQDQSPRGRRVVQATGANQPAVSGDELQWDGTNDVLLEPLPTATFVTAQQLPDASGNAGVGTAFSATHLAYDWVSGGFVVGNDGRATTPQSITGNSPSLVFINSTGTTKTAEIALSTNSSVQGVAVDPVDGNIWAARTDAGRVEKINRVTGAQMATFNFTTPNGLTIQPDGTLWVKSNNETLIKHVTQTGTVLGSFTGSADGIFWDEELQVIWAVGSTALTVYEPITGDALATVALSGVNYLEGVYRSGLTLWTTSNGSFHSTDTPAASPNRSQLRTYNVADVMGLGLKAPYVDVFVLGNVSTVTGTQAWVALGNSLSNAAGNRGVFVGSSGATVQRSIINTGAAGTSTQSATANATTTPNTLSLWHVQLDAVAEVARLYRNGVQVGSDIAIANIDGGLIHARVLAFGANLAGASTLSNYSFLRNRATVIRGGPAALPTLTRQKIEGRLTWDHGQQALLPVGHPYQNSPP